MSAEAKSFLDRQQVKSKFKMNCFALLLLACFVLSVHPEPIGVSGDILLLDRESEDRVNASLVLAYILVDVEAELKYPKKVALKKLLNSTNPQCMEAHYKEFSLVDLFPRYPRMSLATFNNPLVPPTFFSIMVLCSSFTDVLLEYSFEMLMAQHILVKSFIDDQELAEVALMLKYANKYAIDKGIIDQASYNLKHQLSSEEEKKCREWLSQLDIAVDIAEKVGKELFRIYGPTHTDMITTELEKLVFRYGLLVQVSMTSDQKEAEKIRFIKECRQFIRILLQSAKEILVHSKFFKRDAKN